MGRTRHGHWVPGLALGIILLVAACGGSSTDGGVDLGRGPLLAFVGGDGNVWLAREDGAMAHAVTTTPCPATINCFGLPSWSPNGQQLAVFGPTASSQGAQIYFIDRRGLVRRTLVVAHTGAFGPLPLLWSADGTLLAYQSVQVGTPPRLILNIVEAATGAPRATIPLPAPSDVQCPGISPGGPLGSAVDRAVNGVSGVRTTLDWSRDGQTLLISGGSCQIQVQLVARDGTAVPLAPLVAGAEVTQAAFAPDGQHIIAVQSSATEDDLVLYDGQGGHGTAILTDSDPPPDYAPRLAAPSWSADGQTIVFSRGADIWAVDVTGMHARQLVKGTLAGDRPSAEVGPTLAPDGKGLAWVEVTLSSVDAMPRTALRLGDGMVQGAQTITTGALWPAWSKGI